MKILLISHGEFAEGLKKTAEVFFGAKNLYTANVDLETGVTGLRESLQNYIEEWSGEQIVICSDLKGGSANQAACEFINYPNVFLISGTNLAVILQLITETEIHEDKIREIIQMAKEDVVFVNDFIKQITTDSDDE
ncbi:MAG: hypothetical protein HXL50_06795 [Solobacterium sp.]|nr:hypothetical protein [Solobacterium sp.]